MSDPFKNPKARYPYYFGVSILLSLVPAFMRIVVQNTEAAYTYGWVVFADILVYYIMAIYSAVSAFLFLNRSGMSSEARKMIVKRHISGILLGIVCQIYNLVSRINNIFSAEDSLQGWYLEIFSVLFFGQGIWLNLVRLLEPRLIPVMWA